MLGVAQTEQLAAGNTKFAKNFLAELVELAKAQNLDALTHKKVCALITIAVYYKDVCADEIPLKFRVTDGCTVTVARGNDEYTFGHCFNDFSRLVVTPLTIKAINYYADCHASGKFGFAHGPAGTGKTETVKDLAKSLGRCCIVVNCSDQLTVEIFESILKGCEDANTWVCFDEFNRVTLEVMNGLVAVFNKYKHVKLFMTCNPGYAGRTALPDSLKEFFGNCDNGKEGVSNNGVAMLVPDFALIAQVMLYCEGVQQAGMFSKKLCEAFMHFKENCSKQPHYDFGMRAVKSITKAMGHMKKCAPAESDCVLFKKVLDCMVAAKFTPEDMLVYKAWCECASYFATKLSALREVLEVRHSAIVVTKKARNGLISALVEQSNADYIAVELVDAAQAYGEYENGCWKDGVLTSAYRQLLNSSAPMAVLEVKGVINAVTVENLNCVLDDNKKLRLDNGDVLVLGENMRILFELENCDEQSPAFVSRNGVVYL